MKINKEMHIRRKGPGAGKPRKNPMIKKKIHAFVKSLTPTQRAALKSILKLKKKSQWVHGLELDGLKENKIPFKILKKQGHDLFLIEASKKDLERLEE